MPTDLAIKDYYFRAGCLPITMRRIRADVPAGCSHQHDFTTIRHKHNFKELIVITRGEGEHHIDGLAEAVCAGDVFLIHEGQEHFFSSIRQLEMINVMFIHEQLNLPESELRKLPGYCTMFLLEPQYRRPKAARLRMQVSRQQLLQLLPLMQNIERELESAAAGSQVLVYSSFLELLTKLCRMYTHTPCREAQSALRMAEVIGQLERNFERCWTLPELLAISHMSKSNFLRVFRKATGLTPVEYLTNIRIQESMRLLTGTDFNMSEIASRVGFCDSNYFSRRFKESNGISPTQYRYARR